MTSLAARFDGYRTKAIALDQASAAEGDAFGVIARRVRGIAAWPKQRVLMVGGVAVVVLLATSAIGQQFATIDAIKYTASTFNTLSIMVLAVVALGRWVRVAPRTFRRIAFVSALLLGFIVLTGSAVRLTGSGLGCVDWPTCNEGKVVPALDDYHGKIEFGNRIVTGLCVFVAGLGVLASLVRIPYRRDLVKLGGLVVVAILGNAILGGLTVLSGLRPEYVVGHHLLAIAALAGGLVLFHRAGEAGPSGDLLGRDRVPLSAPSAPRVHTVSRVLTAASAVTLVLGTIVTGSGPHGGSEDTPRFGFSMEAVARLHSLAAWMMVASALAMVMLAVRSTGDGAHRLRTRAQLLLIVLGVQGAVGYVQWFNQVPAALVQVHVLGSVLVWCAVVWVRAAVTLPADSDSRAPTTRTSTIPLRRPETLAR